MLREILCKAQKYIHHKDKIMEKILLILTLAVLSLNACNSSDKGKGQQKTFLGLLLLSGTGTEAQSCKIYPTGYTVSGTALDVIGYSAGSSTCSFDSASKKFSCTGANVETKTYSSVSDFIAGRPLSYISITQYATGGSSASTSTYNYDSLKRKTKKFTAFSGQSYTQTTAYGGWDSQGRPRTASSDMTGCNTSYLYYSYTDLEEIMTVTENGSGGGCLSGIWTSVKTFDSNQNLISQTVSGIVVGQASFTINATAKVCE